MGVSHPFSRAFLTLLLFLAGKFIHKDRRVHRFFFTIGEGREGGGGWWGLGVYKVIKIGDFDILSFEFCVYIWLMSKDIGSYGLMVLSYRIGDLFKVSLFKLTTTLKLD